MIQVTEVGVKKKTSSLRSSGSSFGISVRFLKLTMSFMTCTLAELFNKFVSSGITPENFKTAKLTPIFKKDPSKVIKNHRLTLVTSKVSKVFFNLI